MTVDRCKTDFWLLLVSAPPIIMILMSLPIFFRPKNPMRYVKLRTVIFVDVILVFTAQKLKIQNGWPWTAA